MNIFIIDGASFISYHATHVLFHKGSQVSTLALLPASTEELLPREADVSLGDFNERKDEDILSLMVDCEGAHFLKPQTRETFFDRRGPAGTCFRGEHWTKPSGQPSKAAVIR